MSKAWPTDTSGMLFFPNGDFLKSGVGGQVLFISPSNDTVVAWFCTGDGNDREESMARAIIYSLVD